MGVLSLCIHLKGLLLLMVRRIRIFLNVCCEELRRYFNNIIDRSLIFLVIRSLANKMAKSIALWRIKWRSLSLFGEMESPFGEMGSRFGEMESRFGEMESRFGEENGEVNRALAKKMAKSIALWRRRWRSQSRFGEENGEDMAKKKAKKMAKYYGLNI